MRLQIAKNVALFIDRNWYAPHAMQTYYGLQLDCGPFTICIGNGKTYADFDNGVE